MNAMTNLPTAATRELSLTREIDAPPALVYKAWTHHLAEWFAPKPMAITETEIDFRAGGRFKFTMKDPASGAEYPCDGVFLEVVPNERIVSTDAFTPGWQPTDKAFMVAITTFEDLGNGKTRYTARARHWSDEDLKAHEQMGFHEGWGQVADQMIDVVMKLKAKG
jgi:uncharacterized protein YndB with AHSA1/START domain